MRKIYAALLLNEFKNSKANGTIASDVAAIPPEHAEFVANDWNVWARDDQLPPGKLASGEDWRVWFVLGGRGSGKTRTGAEWVREIALNRDGILTEPARVALVGKTLDDVRNVMIEGVSGLLQVHPSYERPCFEPSKRRITWRNGSIAEMFSSDQRDGLRGPQFTHAWCDEIAKWREGEKTWDVLQFGLRLGAAPQCIVTTTPRPHPYLKRIMSDPATVTVKLKTEDNDGNLAPAFLAEMTRRYDGTGVGRQELLGEWVEESSDSLWRRAWIDGARVAQAPDLKRVVVAVDPPVTSTAGSDACGIVVAGIGVDKRAYVLADRTIQGRTPDVWAKAALAAYDDFAADRIVAEVNQGGDLVVGVLKQYREVPVSKVYATRGKYLRAEPVAALYAEGRVAHVGCHHDLEAQMCAFGGDGLVSGRSPDRVDALVWAVTELLLSGGAEPKVRMV